MVLAFCKTCKFYYYSYKGIVIQKIDNSPWMNLRVGDDSISVHISRPKVCCPTPSCYSNEFGQVVLDDCFYVDLGGNVMESGKYIRFEVD